MSNTNAIKSRIKSTVYLDAHKQRMIRLWAMQNHKSVSDVIDESLAGYLEDIADFVIAKERLDTAAFSPWDQLKAELAADGLL